MSATERPGREQTSDWEQAYLRFETPEEAVAKFERRLRHLGVDAWDRDLRVLELMSGQGSGIRAWHNLGFRNVEGIDHSRDLVAVYDGPARCHVGDVRDLPFADASMDVLCVQGGLHHLETMDDLRRALAEAARVLAPGGRLIVVEPWLTPFLRAVHALCEVAFLRAAWLRLDALATMIQLEGDTYRRWLSMPEPILAAIGDAVTIRRCERRWGKLMLVGEREDS